MVFPGEGCMEQDLSDKEVVGSASISKLNYIFFGCVGPENIFQIIKINIFRGDLTDISAKNEALAVGLIVTVDVATSASFLAEMLVRSPRNQCIFIIYKNIF